MISPQPAKDICEIDTHSYTPLMLLHSVALPDKLILLHTSFHTLTLPIILLSPAHPCTLLHSIAILTHSYTPSHTLEHSYTHSHTITHYYIPSHALSLPRTSSHTLSLHHTPSHTFTLTLTLPCTFLHTLTLLHTLNNPSHALMHSYSPSHTLKYSYTPLHTLKFPLTPSHTLTLPHKHTSVVTCTLSQGQTICILSQIHSLYDYPTYQTVYLESHFQFPG